MNKKPLFNIVLYTPEIPGNTGSIGRTCVALGLQLILIKPLGFDLSEKAVRRAGLDYWKHVDLIEYNSWDDFIANENPHTEQLFLFSKNATQTYFKANFKADDYLVFGAETKGLPQELFDSFEGRFYSLPQYSEHIRSLNLANTATAVAYEALRQIKFNTA
ncbi:MAG: tRNA (cytidine(34)-2'-O)-methyltransferase [Bacteriovoracia bacterium]